MAKGKNRQLMGLGALIGNGLPQMNGLNEIGVERIDAYHRKKKSIPRMVRDQVRKNKSVLYGGHALNAHMPKDLDRHTEDFDVYTKDSMKSARALEKKLDKKFNHDVFYLQPIPTRTVRVMNRVTERNIADFTQEEGRVPFVKKGGLRVASLDHIEADLRGSLQNMASQHRHAKDRDSLRRIAAYRFRKRKRR